MDSPDKENRFSVSDHGGYIHLETWGALELAKLDAPADAAIALAKKRGVTKLLDDIRKVDSSNVNLHVQAKGMSILWKLRFFKKVAIIFKGKEIGFLFFSSLEAVHLNSTFKGFTNETDAIAWLEED